MQPIVWSARRLIRLCSVLLKFAFILILLIVLLAGAAWAAAPRLLAPAADLAVERQPGQALELIQQMSDPQTLRSGQITIDESSLNAVIAEMLRQRAQSAGRNGNLTANALRVELKPSLMIIRGSMATPPEWRLWINTEEIGFDWTMAPRIEGTHLLLPIIDAHIGSVPIPATFLLSLLEGRTHLPEDIKIERATPSYDLRQLQPVRTPIGPLKIMPVRLAVESGQIQVQWVTEIQL